MARHGENIRKREDGRWEARYQMFDKSKGRKIYRSVYGSTYEEAKEKRNRIIRMAEFNPDSEKGNFAKGMFCPSITFSQAAAEWMEEVSDKCRYSTYVKYTNIYRIHLEGILGSCLLSGILNQELQKKISDHLLGSGMSNSIRKSICCVANQILSFANGKYFVHVPQLRVGSLKPAGEVVEVFSNIEQSRLLSCIYNSTDKFKIILLLCLYTGMRLGELCALKWDDFDFRDGTVVVSRTVQRIVVREDSVKTALIETNPKSESSKRIIPLTSEIARLINGLSKDQPYVFGGDKPLEPRTMQYRFKKILREADIGDRNFHILRHTFATNCVESGMDIKTLSVILGHSDVKITLNRYVHPTMDSKRKQMERLPDLYGQIRGHEF